MLNEKNYDYLKRQLLFTGFGEEMDKPLRVKIEAGHEKFSLEHNRLFGKDEAVCTLHFSKGTKGDNYFFNSYDLLLKQPGKEDVRQIVFMGNKFNYTLKERYNMLDGRAVFKEQPVLKKDETTGRMVATEKTYAAWKDLDMKNTDKLGNFAPKTMYWDHQKELRQYPVKELNTQYDLSRLLASMEKGNKAKVTILKGTEETKMFVAANPRQQRLDFYDADGQRLTVNKVEKLQQDEAKKLDRNNGERQSAAKQNTEKQAPAQNEGRRQQNRQRMRVS